MGEKAVCPDDAEERWDAGPCEADHDGYTIALGWMAGDRKALEFRYPCGCVKQWIALAPNAPARTIDVGPVTIGPDD